MKLLLFLAIVSSLCFCCLALVVWSDTSRRYIVDICRRVGVSIREGVGVRERNGMVPHGSDEVEHRLRRPSRSGFKGQGRRPVQKLKSF